MQPVPEDKIYEVLGEDGLRKLVRAFYSRVPKDDILGPMYPKHEMEAAELRLADFLIQRFGGPQTYSLQRGHPRLRMRHGPFKIGVAARNRWMKLMTESLEETRVAEEVKATLLPYFANTATFMMNHQD